MAFTTPLNKYELGITERNIRGYLKINIHSDLIGDAEYATINVTNKVIQVVKHYLSIPKAAKKVMKMDGNSRMIHIGNCDLDIPPGRYYFDMEESTEDKLICYWREQI